MPKETEICHVWTRVPVFGRHVITLDDFLDFPPNTRAQLIADCAVEFFRSSGSVIPLRDALDSILDDEPSRQEDLGFHSAAEFSFGEHIEEPANLLASDDEAEPALERRRFLRERMVRPLRVLRETEAKERVAVSEDVSTGGLRFRSRSRYSPGDRLIVAWSPSEGAVQETWRRATVVRSIRDREISGTLFPRRVAVSFDRVVAPSAYEAPHLDTGT